MAHLFADIFVVSLALLVDEALWKSVLIYCVSKVIWHCHVGIKNDGSCNINRTNFLGLFFIIIFFFTFYFFLFILGPIITPMNPKYPNLVMFSDLTLRLGGDILQQTNSHFYLQIIIIIINEKRKKNVLSHKSPPSQSQTTIPLFLFQVNTYIYIFVFFVLLFLYQLSSGGLAMHKEFYT